MFPSRSWSKGLSVSLLASGFYFFRHLKSEGWILLKGFFRFERAWFPVFSKIFSNWWDYIDEQEGVLPSWIRK